MCILFLDNTAVRKSVSMLIYSTRQLKTDLMDGPVVLFNFVNRFLDTNSAASLNFINLISQSIKEVLKLFMYKLNL